MEDEQPLTGSGLLIGVPCKFCDGDTAQTLRFNGPSIRYLKEGESACASCWIEHVVEEKIIKCMNLKRTEDELRAVHSTYRGENYANEGQSAESEATSQGWTAEEVELARCAFQDQRAKERQEGDVN